MSWWKNAFAMEPQREFHPTPRQEQLIDRLAAKVAERRMTVPAMLFLETIKPLNFVGSQVLVFLGPLVKTLFAAEDYDEVARFLEHRRGIEFLADRIEAKANANTNTRTPDRDSLDAHVADDSDPGGAPPTSAER